MALLVGCGQAGDLYLPDDVKAQQLEQQAVGADEAAAKRLLSEAQTLRQRYQQEQSLRSELVEAEAKEQQLRAAGDTVAADETLKQVNRLRYDLGQLMLQQQADR